MVRVAGLVDHSSAGTAPSDGRGPTSALHEIADARARARGRAGDDPARLAAARAGRRGHPHPDASPSARRPSARRLTEMFEHGDLPRPDAARGRPRPALPVHLEPLAVARRVRRRPADRRARLRAREGAGGAARGSWRSSAAAATSPLEDVIADNLHRAVPRHGVRRARHVPRHARRRLRHLRGDRGPARGRRAGAARAAASATSCGSRSRPRCPTTMRDVDRRRARACTPTTSTARAARSTWPTSSRSPRSTAPTCTTGRGRRRRSRA